ncbi:GTP-binding protein REM 1-like [Pomacea canaliculata]|nr:GTP-binding protein REM 1-like [Pomacea canaliculata]XP_025075937.1 GTP-binding protein REM 1-like [Pomacea canaliculata]
MATIMMDILVEGERVPDEKLVRVSPLRESGSSSHSRSSSFRNRPRPKLSLDIQAAQRPRTNSLPNTPAFLPLPAPDWMKEGAGGGSGLCRVRSFKTTSKGIVNSGDSFKRSTHSLASNGSISSMDPDAHQGGTSTVTQAGGNVVPTTLSSLSSTGGGGINPRRESLNSVESSGLTQSVTSSVTISHYRVLMMGAPGVGKTALTRQFMTSEYKGTYETTTPEIEEDGMSVSVLLDGEESVMDFLDEEMHPDGEGEDLSIDAYVVVFSVTDVSTYNYAVSTVRRLRVEKGVDRAIILVGNKIDLARQRRVTKHEATSLASKYDCRYTETTAALNQHIDELLVGILSQIRQKLHHPDLSRLSPPESSKPRCRSKSPGRAMSFFQKLFRHGSGRSKTKTSDTLFVK